MGQPRPSYLLCVLFTIIFSPFVEQHRWPFSFPADPEIYQRLADTTKDRQDLSNELSLASADASRWKFSYNLRYGATAQNGGLLECPYVYEFSKNHSTAWNNFSELQPMLELSHWHGLNSIPHSAIAELPSGFNILIGVHSGDIFSCATTLSRELGTHFSNRKVSLKTEQVTPGLTGCKKNCMRGD